MRNTGHTTVGATATAEGWIAHIEVFADCGIVHAPVKLAMQAGKLQRAKGDGFGSWDIPIPMRRDGRLVYALPGGAEYTP